MKKIIITICVLGTAGLVGFTLMNNKSEMEEEAAMAQMKNETVSVVTATVTKASIKDDFSSTGNFDSFREVTVASQKQGKVERIAVKEGDVVKEGQLIAKLDTDMIEANLLSAEATLSKAKKDLDRFEELEPKGAVTPQQLDEMRLAYKNAAAHLSSVRKELSDATIKAPFDGTINARYVENGSYLAAGGKIVEIVDVSTLKMKVAVSESEVLKVKKDQLAEVRADVLGSATFQGKISFIGVKADNSLRYPVEIQIKNSGNVLKAGMYGSADFNFVDTKDALVIPRSAIAGSLKDPKVYAILDGKAVLQEITIGTIGDFGVEVLKGLNAGDQVVTDGQINLINGSAVTITKR